MIDLDKARVMIREALAHGTAEGMKPLAVAVLDAGGHVIAFERSDGAPPGRFAIARGKAHGAVMMGMGGRAQSKLAEGRPHFSASLVGAFDGGFVPVPGGVLVRDAAGAVVGAVGVTGDTSENDAAAALAGIAAAGFEGEA